MIYKYDNKDIFVEVSGEGDAVLLLHGWGCTHEIFAALAKLLSGQYKVYSFDFPGFGASQEPDAVWGVEEYTRMVERFVVENKIDNPSLVGHSFGGRVSLLYSSRNKVARVVLVDAAGIKPQTLMEILLQGLHLQMCPMDLYCVPAQGEGREPDEQIPQEQRFVGLQ
ncbi:MAG: alpha/beta hydrolase [Bacteroidaceae bacterium]|nr:alpha/beta hydrolase [Bacteroidaceae bacterium]